MITQRTSKGGVQELDTRSNIQTVTMQTTTPQEYEEKKCPKATHHDSGSDFGPISLLYEVRSGDRKVNVNITHKHTSECEVR